MTEHYGLVRITKSGRRIGQLPMFTRYEDAEKRAREKRKRGLTIEIKKVKVDMWL